MYKFTEARILEPEEIIEITTRECLNPCTERMVFIESRGQGDSPSRIFPCYVTNVGRKGSEDGEIIALEIVLVQMRDGEYMLLRIMAPFEQMGVKWRLWDQPPTAESIAAHPFVDGEQVS